MSSNLDEIQKQRELTNRDLMKTYARWYLAVEVSNSYERLQALAFCNALSGA